MELIEIPKAAQHSLEDNEIVHWVGKPARMPKFNIWMFRIIYGFAAFMGVAAVIQIGVPLLKGEVPMIEGEAVTIRRALPPTLLIIVTLGGFFYIFKNNLSKYLYIVTDRRAFHYRPVWGGSWRWVKHEGFKRNYDDPEYSPISGGYFTNETIVSSSGSDGYGTIEIGPLKSLMDDAQTISTIKAIMPVLDNIIYDPSNLDFLEVENPALAEKEINSVLRKFKNEQTHQSI